MYNMLANVGYACWRDLGGLIDFFPSPSLAVFYSALFTFVLDKRTSNSMSNIDREQKQIRARHKLHINLRVNAAYRPTDCVLLVCQYSSVIGCRSNGVAFMTTALLSKGHICKIVTNWVNFQENTVSAPNSRWPLQLILPTACTLKVCNFHATEFSFSAVFDCWAIPEIVVLV